YGSSAKNTNSILKLERIIYDDFQLVSDKESSLTEFLNLLDNPDGFTRDNSEELLELIEEFINKYKTEHFN
ncbi:MAG: hypothetical protein CL823_05650, partial [Crocinitomicaceae bacterium]|nr:hypothetical protein [Crocinitomicaceae bacterium]